MNLLDAELFASIGLLAVPEQCTFGSAEGMVQCTNLAAFCIGVDDVVDMDESGLAAVVMCHDHLMPSVHNLAALVLENKVRVAEARLALLDLAATPFPIVAPDVGAQIANEWDDDEDLTPLDEEEELEYVWVPDSDLGDLCAHCVDGRINPDDDVCNHCEKCNDLECCPLVDDEPVLDQCYVYLAMDSDAKPWSVSCDCGFISNHKTEDAASRKAKKHIKEFVSTHEALVFAA